jgi:hypothetical protein
VPVYYCTSFCNHGHNTASGIPLNHECYVLPPRALALESVGKIERALEVLAKARPLRVHPGQRCRHKWELRMQWDTTSHRRLPSVTMCEHCGLEK